MMYDLDPPVIKLFVTSEENIEYHIEHTAGEVLPGWNRFYSALPDGLHRVAIWGTEAALGSMEFSLMTSAFNLVRPMVRTC